MKTMNSISGGQSSAYIAANYEADINIFALVRTDDKNCLYPDKKLRELVEDKIQKPFIGTLEDDTIIHTILDLEQFIGKPITWVSGDTFDYVVDNFGGWLPSMLRRYCTTHMKMYPIIEWWFENIKDPVICNIGFRANEAKRATSMLEKLSDNGFSTEKIRVGKHKNGRNKWQNVEWRVPFFPLINDNIYKEDIVKFWDDKPVRFAEYNNCVGCFHKKAPMLKYMSKQHPAKFKWFVNQEKKGKGTWKENVSYQKILELEFTGNLFDGQNGCSSGFCGF